MSSIFQVIAKKISTWSGSSAAFITALSVIILWGLTGPLFHYSDTWQLVINTATTIITFLMVFLIQNTQNRDTRALQLKLDELIRATADARNRLIDLEDLSDEEMERLHKEFCELKEHYNDKVEEIAKHQKKRRS